MRVTETVKAVKEETVTTEIICNKCGKKVNIMDDLFSNNKMHDFSVRFGYCSNHDGEIWNFHLCEDCIIKFVKTFKYEPDVDGYII